MERGWGEAGKKREEAEEDGPIPASAANSVPFLRSGKFYALIIDAWRRLCTADSA